MTVNESDVDKWIAQLHDDDFKVRNAAIDMLRDVNTPRLNRALEALKAGDGFMSRIVEQDRFYFAVAITLAERGIFHAYGNIVNEDAPFLRTRVVKALQQIGTERAIHAAEMMLSSSNAGERYWAAEILKSLKSPD